MSAIYGKPAYWGQATVELAAVDPVMADLIASYPNISLEGRGEVFHTLARAIVGQQISVKAADSVWARFAAHLQIIEAPRVLASGVEELRACGLSARKVEYLYDLAKHQQAGLLDVALWHDLDDEAVIGKLVDIRGIGRWTAEMFLIFYLLRPNVLPLDDIGLLKAIALLYHDGERLPRGSIRDLAQKWQPWCTVATWYLWRSLDPEPVEY
jgi:DNA-3-methyladenine glycosylase II